MGTVTGQGRGSEAEQPAPKLPLSKYPSIPLQVSAFSSAPAALSLQTAMGPAPPRRGIKRLGWFLTLGTRPGQRQPPRLRGISAAGFLTRGLFRAPLPRMLARADTPLPYPQQHLQRSLRVSHERSLALPSSHGGETEARRPGPQINRKTRPE